VSSVRSSDPLGMRAAKTIKEQLLNAIKQAVAGWTRT
jgi:hypothetical protein